MGDDRWGEAGAGLAAKNGTHGTQARAARDLVEALSPLDARTAALLRALAHQLRNPLTAALGYLELLGDGSLGPLTAEQQRVLKVVADGMFRVAELAEGLEPGASAGRGVTFAWTRPSRGGGPRW